jgi:hypothetical protein
VSERCLKAEVIVPAASARTLGVSIGANARNVPIVRLAAMGALVGYHMASLWTCCFARSLIDVCETVPCTNLARWPPPETMLMSWLEQA